MDRTVFIASDHAGFLFKSLVVDHLKILKFTVTDLGPSDEQRVDYPDFADKVVANVLKTPGTFGILICGSGQGMAMRANKTPGIRAALCWDKISAKLTREHNDANVLCIGGRLIPHGLGIEIVDTFFSTNFEGGRHTGRVVKLSLPPVKI